MNKILEQKKILELKSISIDLEIPVKKTKKEIIEDIMVCFKEYETYMEKKVNKYEKIQQLGNKGKEGIVYLVKNKKNGVDYAMKTFKKNKSSTTLKKEAYLQDKVYKFDKNVTPKVIEIDSISKYIVMEIMDKHLYEDIKKQSGNLKKSQQLSLIKLYKTLDKAGVFHADSNILNYMFKGNQLGIIDFGMAKEIDETLIKKLGTNTPNMKFMLLGFVLKLKEMNCPSQSYKYLVSHISQSDREKFNLNIG